MQRATVLEREPTEEEYFDEYSKYISLSSSWFILVFILRSFGPFCLALQSAPFENPRSVRYYIEEFKLHTKLPTDNSPGNITTTAELPQVIMTRMLLLRSIGYALGAISGGIGCDIFGRHRTSSIGSVVWISAATAFLTLQSQLMVEIFYVFLNACSSFVNVSSFVNFSEIASIRYRVMVIYSTVFYVVGDVFVKYIALHLHVWKYLLTFLTSIFSCLVFGTWYIPESPRWLLNKNKTKEAYHVLSDISGKSYKVQFVNQVEHNSNKRKIFKEMFRYLLYHSVTYFTICNLLTGIASVHYCCSKLHIILYQARVGSFDKFENLAELLGFLFFIPTHIFFGKRYGIFFCFILMCLENALAMILSTPDSAVYFHLFATMAGLAATSFCWLYFLDIVPTFLRGTSIGVGFCMYNVSVGITTFIMMKLPDSPDIYYHLGFFIASLFGITALQLPITTNQELPNFKL